MTNTNFKIGDRVKVTDTFIRQWNGALGTIERHDFENMWVVKPDDPAVLNDLPFNPVHPGFMTIQDINLEKLEEPHTFKIGDRVKVTGNSTFKGESGKVIDTAEGRLEGSRMARVRIGTRIPMWFSQNQLKKVETVPVEQSHEGFKIGDRVKLVQTGVSEWQGATGIVEDNPFDMLQVKLDEEFAGMPTHTPGSITLASSKFELLENRGGLDAPEQLILNSGPLNIGDKVQVIVGGSTGVVHSINSAPLDYPVNVILDGHFQETRSFRHTELKQVSRKLTEPEPEEFTDADKLQALAQQIMNGADSHVKLVQRCDDEEFDTVLFCSKDGPDVALVYRVAVAMQERKHMQERSEA